MTPAAVEDHRKTVRDSLASGISVDILARIGYLVTRFFIPPFVLAHVTLEAYGLWAAAFILVSYVGVSTLGVSNVYIKFVAEHSARREYDECNRLLSTGFFTTAPLCLAVYAAVHAGWPHVVEWLKIAPGLRVDAREVVLMVVAIFLSSIGLSVFRDALTGAQRTAAVQLTWVVAYLVETGLILALVGAGRGVRGLAEAFLVRTAIEIGASAFLAFRFLPWLRIAPRLVGRAELRKIAAFGGTVQAASLIAIALNSIERALAVPLLGLEAAGLLDVGKKLPAMAASIPSAFAASLVPAASYLQGGLRGDARQREAIEKLYLKGARYMNLVAGFVCGLLAAIPGPLLGVWLGRTYPGAALLMLVFSLSTQVHLMTGPGTSLLKGMGLPRQEFWYSLPNVGLLLGAIPLSRALTGAWSATAIGIAVAASTILSAGLFIARANGILDIPAGRYLRRVVWPGVVPYLVGILFCWPAVHFTQMVSRWAGAAILAGVGASYAVLLGVLVYRFVLDAGERLWFRAMLSNALTRIR